MRGAFVFVILTIDLIVAGCGGPTNSQSVFPTPGPSRTVFANSHFGYQLTYPSQWRKEDLESSALIRFVPATTQRVPDALSLDILCDPNPGRLSAELWWQQGQRPRQTQTAVGIVKLKSGISAFVSQGHSQVSFTMYTVVQGTTTCELTAYDIDKLNNPYAIEAINTFTWR